MSASSLRAKLNIVDSEKTPKLQMANIKESMALGRKLNFLDRSEKLVVNRIRADQKVLYKRFQMKLALTKLEHARRTGDKEVEREMIKSRGGQAELNTNVGTRGEEEEQTMLRKIWQSNRPMRKYQNRVKSSTQAMRVGEGEGGLGDDLAGDIIDELPRACNMNRHRPTTAFVTRMASASSKELPGGELGQWRKSGRDSTPSAHSKKGEEEEKVEGGASIEKTCPPAGLPNKADVDWGQRAREGTITNKTNNRPHFLKNRLPQGGEKGEGRWANTIELDAIEQVLQAQPSASRWCTESTGSPNLSSRRPSQRNRKVHAKSAPAGGRRQRQRSAAPQNTHPLRTNIFEEETGPSLLDVHRLLVKKANYDERVKDFCATVKPLKASQDNITDYYYSLRLMETKDKTPGVTLQRQQTETITPCTSNVRVRSLTLKSLNTN